MDKYIVRVHPAEKYQSEASATPSGQAIDRNNNNKKKNNEENVDDPTLEPAETNNEKQYSEEGSTSFSSRQCYKRMYSKGSREPEEENDAKKKRNPSVERNVDVQACKKNYDYDWLTTNNHGKPYCSPCEKNIIGGTYHIHRHGSNDKHVKRVEAAKKTMTLEKVYDKSPQIIIDLEIRRVELKIIMQVVEHNFPFRFLDHYPDFLRSCFKDSGVGKRITCARTKGQKLVTTILAPASIEEAAAALQISKYSIIIDETTDISTYQCLGIVARYFCMKHSEVRDRFLGIVVVENSTADGLHSSVTNYLSQNNIPLSNMIGFASDNAAVMRGHLNGVLTKFKMQLPSLFSLGCICHSFNLCSSNAAKVLPKTIEDLARDVNNYFCHSSKRLNKFYQLQTLANVKNHRLLKLSNTRWLSLEAVAKRMLEQWEVLESFFAEAVAEDGVQAASTILHALQSPIFKLYYMFLAYVLELVNRLNVEFQSEKPKLYTLLPRIIEVYRTLLKNFLKKECVQGAANLNNINCQNPDNFLKIEEVYFGARAENFIAKNQVSQADVNTFKVRALNYYVTLCSQIQMRIDFNDSILIKIQMLDPKSALKGESPSIIPLVQLFPNLVDESNYGALNSEWRMLPDVAMYFEDDNKFEQFINTIGKLKNALDQKMFPRLHEFLMAIASLPHSSAAAERVFSRFKLIKTHLRNRMAIETCNALLLSKELMHNKICSTWEPSNELLKRKPKEKVFTEILDIDIFEVDKSI